MDRRSLIKAAGVLAATGLPAPAIAQSTPRLRWRLAISFPRSLDILFGMGETIAATVAEATDGAFSIQTFAPGEIVPAFAVLDAVSDATVEIGVSPAYYYFGKDPTFALFTAMPFGPTSRMQSAWYAEGGGLELLQEFAGRYGVVAWPCGNTGTQMAGWFRKEVGSVDRGPALPHSWPRWDDFGEGRRCAASHSRARRVQRP